MQLAVVMDGVCDWGRAGGLEDALDLERGWWVCVLVVADADTDRQTDRLGIFKHFLSVALYVQVQILSPEIQEKRGEHEDESRQV